MPGLPDSFKGSKQSFYCCLKEKAVEGRRGCGGPAFSGSSNWGLKTGISNAHWTVVAGEGREMYLFSCLSFVFVLFLVLVLSFFHTNAATM